MAAVLLIAYGWISFHRRREWPDVGHVFSITATTTAVVAGVRLIVVGVTANDIAPFQEEDHFFIPVAGLALILVSSKEIWKVFVKQWKADGS